ncbi:MAG: hypothetical protein V7K27_12260 [Nostoc sp.]
MITTEVTELETVIIRFRDNGSGIDSEIQSKIFELFLQLNLSTKERD